ncbi:MAG: type II and III secretion system protein family protein [Holosporaceae bacterium]|nr:type II and III secretion system protein family protein [Holosporaceae bacterium]
MKKKKSAEIGFILSVCITFSDTTCTVADKKNDTLQAETNKQSEIFINSHYGEEKEIEVNSVNFIKLNKKAGEIFISNPAVADVEMLSDTSLYLTGITPGTTSLVVHDKQGNVIVDYQIRVVYPVRRIKDVIAKMYPDSDVEIVSIDDSIILRGRVPSPEIASDVQDIAERFVNSAKIINKLFIQTATQVMLKVKIAEVSRTLTKSLGINWRAISYGKDVNGMHYGFVSGDASAFPAFASSTTAIAENLTKQSGVLGTKLLGGRWLVHSGGSNGLSALIEALASESFASVLAEPTLIALSGKTATFKAGGEEGYRVKQSGGDVTTTEFKQWGTSIEFTPVVLSENRINIKVKPVVSTVSHENQDDVPSLTTKEAETTVELGSGQSLAIAGLLQTTKNSNTTETPFLADLPLFGALFKSSNINSTEKELVIIITAFIVKPSDKQLKVPNDMVPRMYSPLESILTRKFHRNMKKNHSAGFSLK